MTSDEILPQRISNLTLDPEGKVEGKQKGTGLAPILVGQEDFGNMSRKFLKKLAKELNSAYELEISQAELVAKRMESRIKNAIRADSRLGANESLFKSEYTSKILELVKNIKAKLVDPNPFLGKAEEGEEV